MESRAISNETLQHATNALDHREPLEKHIDYFGGHQPEGVSYSSIAHQNMLLGDSNFAAKSNAAIVMAVAGTQIKGCPFAMFKPKEAVGVLNHPCSTRIFNLDGSINEDRWQELLKFSENNEEGIHIITEPNFYKFLAACRQQETRSDPFFFGRTASNGEWKAYFNKFSDNTNANVRYVTIERLRSFFEDSAKVGEEVEQKSAHRM